MSPTILSDRERPEGLTREALQVGVAAKENVLGDLAETRVLV